MLPLACTERDRRIVTEQSAPGMYVEFLTAGEAAGRRFAAPVMHVLFASVWGYLTVRARVDGQALLPAAIRG